MIKVNLLSSQQLADAAGCHISYAQRCRRIGKIVAAAKVWEKETEHSTRGHWAYYYAPESIVLLVAHKALGKSRSGRNDHAVKSHRKPCPEMGRQCVVFDLEDSCLVCRERMKVEAKYTTTWEVERLGGGR